jgi:transposase
MQFLIAEDPPQLLQVLLIAARRRVIRAVCVDMWEPFQLSLQAPLPHARIVSDTCHVLRHASETVDETRRAECFRHGAKARGLLRGTRGRLLRRWTNLDWKERQPLRDLFSLNRRLAKASLLTAHLAQLGAYTDEGAAPAAASPTASWRSGGNGCRPSSSSAGC